MRAMIALAVKDMRILLRNKGRIFFTFIWPIIVTVLFGLAFGGNNNGDGQSKVKLALVDEDNTGGSRAFAKAIEESFELTPMNRADAENAVRRGQQIGYIALTPGFGIASERMFYGQPKEIELGVDPARRAEKGMIEGLLLKHASEDMQQLFTDPSASSRMVDKALGEMKDAPPDQVASVQKFLGELKTFVNTPQPQATASQQAQWQPLKIVAKDVARQRSGEPDNAFAITFPQGVIWGLIGCMMTFGISLVSERTRGTFVRLRIAPLTRAQILGGKALACFVSIVFVQAMLFTIAWYFGVRPTSFVMLIVACVSAAICFVGFMMLVAGLGRTEETAAGAAWAVLMPLAMFGGAMVPTFVMPQWMQSFGYISPVRWAMLAIEGGVWRNFSVAEMAVPCTILISAGIVCFTLGTRALKEA